MAVQRFGVSLKKELLEKLDQLVKVRQFPSRSQAIAYLIEKEGVQEDWSDDQEVAGAIVLVYDHHKRDVADESTRLQHEVHHLILSVQHIHISYERCLETIAVKGKASKLRVLANRLIGMKGVEYGELVMSKSV
ncbi:MAG: nickel-responsive transcriptional regulator NikR [Chlorobi bacterium]|nr:nickel-responsive transcriptional regulator NikR [Chlorobiota bacterium]